LDKIFKEGMAAIASLVAIVRMNPRIRTLGFFVYKPTRGVKENSLYPGKVPVIRLLFQNSAKATFRLKRHEITVKKLNRIAASCRKNNKALAVISWLKVKNKIYHIPLMDFHCEPAKENLKAIKEFLRLAGQKRGVILFSGRSYHYHGAELISRRKWFNFMHKCLLLTGYADERYIAHQLNDNGGKSTLRIAAGGMRQTTPRVVNVL